MRTAIVIQDGVVQLVITPETQFEKDALRSFSDKPTETKIFRGTFYDCQGGWTRWKRTYDPGAYNDTEDQSLIMRVVEKQGE